MRGIKHPGLVIVGAVLTILGLIGAATPAGAATHHRTQAQRVAAFHRYADRWLARWQTKQRLLSRGHVGRPADTADDRIYVPWRQGDWKNSFQISAPNEVGTRRWDVETIIDYWNWGHGSNPDQRAVWGFAGCWYATGYGDNGAPGVFTGLKVNPAYGDNNESYDPDQFLVAGHGGQKQNCDAHILPVDHRHWLEQNQGPHWSITGSFAFSGGSDPGYKMQYYPPGGGGMGFDRHPIMAGQDPNDDPVGNQCIHSSPGNIQIVGNGGLSACT